MSRLLIGLFALLLPLAMSPVSPAAPTAPVPSYLLPPVDYFPTTVGTKWLYQEGKSEWTEVVTKVERIGATKIISVGAEEKDGRVSPSRKVETSAAGLSLLGREDWAEDPPTPWLKLPLEAGKRQWEYYDRGRKGTVQTAASGPELVNVPAGTFRAVRVVFTWPGTPPGTTLLGVGALPGRKTTVWFAPGVGMVKHVTSHSERVMKSFSPSKE